MEESDLNRNKVEEPIEGKRDITASLLRFGWHRRRWIIALSVLLGAVVAFLVARASYETDVLELLPGDGPAVQSFKTYVERFGGLDELYIVFEAPPGQSIADYKGFVDAYVEALGAAPEIEHVDWLPVEPGKDWEYLFDRTLMLLGKEGAARALARFEPSALREELSHTAALLSAPSREVKALVQQDPLGLLRMLQDHITENKAFLDFDPAAEGYVSRDGRYRLVIAKPTLPPFDAKFCRRLEERLAAIEQNSLAQPATLAASDDTEPALPPPRIDFAGAYRISLDAERMIRTEMWTNATASLGGILLLVFIVFRSHWILLCATLTIGLAGLSSLALVALSNHKLLAASSGGAAMLFGLTIDGVLLLYARFLEERARGVTIEDIPRPLAGTASSVVLGMVTSAATFLALALIDFPSLEELGRLVAIGMLLGCLLTLLIVPAFFGLLESRRCGWSFSAPWLGRLVKRRPRAILWGATVVTAVAVLAVPRLRVVTSLDKLQPATEGMELSRDLMARFSIPEDVLLVLAAGPELDPLLAKNQRLLETLNANTAPVSVSSPVTLLPPRAAQEEVGRLIREKELSPAELETSLSDAARQAGFREGVFEPFIERTPRLLDPDERVSYDGYLGHGLGDLVSRFVSRNEDGFMTVAYLYPKGGVEVDLTRLQETVNGVDPSLVVTGVSMVDRELASRFAPQLFKGLLLGAVAVAALIFYSFRRAGLTLLALAPTLVGLLWSGGALALLGVELDLFSAFGVVMVIGVGVDYGIHILHRHCLEEGGGVAEALTWTGAAILFAGVTTMIGFGALIGSSYAPLASMGVMVTVAIACVLATSLLVLPALLEVRKWR